MLNIHLIFDIRFGPRSKAIESYDALIGALCVANIENLNSTKFTNRK